jgi:hypothetical protein
LTRNKHINAYIALVGVSNEFQRRKKGKKIIFVVDDRHDLTIYKPRHGDSTGLEHDIL